jgi:hypothetical protein
MMAETNLVLIVEPSLIVLGASRIQDPPTEALPDGIEVPADRLAAAPVRFCRPAPGCRRRS